VNTDNKRIDKLKLLLSDFRTMHDECEDLALSRLYYLAYEDVFRLIKLESKRRSTVEGVEI